MRKKHAFIADHLAHAKPTPLPKGSEMIPMRLYAAKVEQWDLDVLVVMDALEMGTEPFHRDEFLTRIEEQFQEDERCRRGNPPVDD